jgi:Ca2+:H+ antiporter
MMANGSLLKPRLNWLAVFIPASVLLAYVPSLKNDVALFVCAGLAMVVVSAWIGQSTEKLAVVVGPTWGGMLNAAFGNLPELIFGLIALTKGLGPLVKAAWTGAILGNLLLVLGSSMLFGGFKHGDQRFPVKRANDASTSLLIAVVAVTIPTVYALAFPKASGSSPVGIDDISIGLAVLLLFAYIAGLVQTYLDARKPDARKPGAVVAAELKQQRSSKEKPANLTQPVVMLVISSVLIALLSDYVSDAVDVMKRRFGLTDLFLGVIVIAAIGNVAAQFSAVSMAMKNKMDLAFEIGMSAGTQVALLVVPFLVLMSYVFGKPVDLEFTVAEIVSLGAAAVITTQIAQDGESNWLNGLQMLVVYAMVGVLFFFLPG